MKSNRDQSPLQALLNYVLDQQPSHIQDAIIGTSVTSWFNQDIITAIAEHNLSKEDKAVILDTVQRLALVTPYQNLGYSYHQEVRALLLDRLVENLAEATSVYQRAVTYLRHELTTKADNWERSILLTELGNRLADLAKIYVDSKDEQQAFLTYVAAAEAFDTLGDYKQVMALRIKAGDQLVRLQDWMSLNSHTQQLLDYFSSHPYPLSTDDDIGYDKDDGKDDDIYVQVAKWYEKEAGWYGERRDWSRTKQAFGQAFGLYYKKGNLPQINELKGHIQKLIEEEKERDKSVEILEESLRISEPSIHHTAPNTSTEQVSDPDIESEMKEITERMKIWLPKNQDNQESS
jgi:hypothetical protein